MFLDGFPRQNWALGARLFECTFGVWRVHSSGPMCSSSGCDHTLTPMPSFSGRRSTHYAPRGKEPLALSSRYPSFSINTLPTPESESEDLKQSGYPGEGFHLHGIRLGDSPSHNLPPHLARMKALEAAGKRERSSGDSGGGRRL
jgi:hypothetical protein